MSGAVSSTTVVLDADRLFDGSGEFQFVGGVNVKQSRSDANLTVTSNKNSAKRWQFPSSKFSSIYSSHLFKGQCRVKDKLSWILSLTQRRL